MANTGNKILNRITVTVDGVTTEYDVAYPITAQELSEQIGVTVAKAQQLIDERIIPCANEPGCIDCETCFDPLPAGEFYLDLTTNGRDESGFLTRNGIDECWVVNIS